MSITSSEERSTAAEGTAQLIDTLILGAGVCGIAAGIGLQRAGFDDFVIVDRSDDVGGTWHHNTYPGCAVDIPSQLYSFSYAPSSSWSRVFAPQAEVKDYMVDVVDKFKLRDRIRFGVELLDASWREGQQRWHVTTSDGEYLARHLVIGAGPLHEPMIPDLPGKDDFAGQSFHSSQWPADLDLVGKKVVVLGTGASALQFVPRIQPQVESLTILQRTPAWVMAKADWKLSKVEKALLKLPGAARLTRLGMWAVMDLGMLVVTRYPRIARLLGRSGVRHMRKHIKDPQMVKDLTPTYAPTCKRLGLSNDFYPALAQPNVNLVTQPAASLDKTGVVTADGQHHDADVVIFGTGFHTLQHHPINARVHGIGGHSLDDVWQGNPTAYMGTSVAGFPNAYTMFGPNIGTLSGFVMAEAQTDYLVGAVKALRQAGLASADVTAQAQAEFTAICNEKLKGTTFVIGGCNSYYLGDKGDASLPWPWAMSTMRRRLKKFDLGVYNVVAESAVADERAVVNG